jgi:hypothetical protein
MANIINTEILDVLLQYIEDECDELFLCSDEPTTYTEASSTYNLATVTISASDFTIAAHNTTGRKSTRAAKNGEDVDASGDCVFVAYGRNSDSTLMRRVACSSVTLDSAGQANIGADEVQLSQPS